MMTDEAIIEYVKAQEEEEEEDPAPKPVKKPRISDSRAHQGLAEYFEWMTDREDFSPLKQLQVKALMEKTTKIKNKSVVQKSIASFFQK